MTNWTRYYKSVHTNENKMAQAANKTCERCKRASGLHHCTQCNKVYCDECKHSHLRTEIYVNHNFTLLTEPDINPEKTTGRCTDHNEDFIYFCDDCNQFACRGCITIAHHKHDLVHIKDSNMTLQTEISKYLDSKVLNVRSSGNTFDKKAKTYKKEVEATAKAIVLHGNIIKAMVKKKVDALIKALREMEIIEMKSLSKASSQCKRLLGEATTQQHNFQNMIKECDEVALFQKMKTFKSDINNMKSVDVAKLPSARYNRKHSNFHDVEKLFGKLTLE